MKNVNFKIFELFQHAKPKKAFNSISNRKSMNSMETSWKKNKVFNFLNKILFFIIKIEADQFSSIENFKKLC